MDNQIKLVINNDILNKYYKYYFKKYPRRKKKPIERPIPPSLNQWMVMPRFQMNNQKQIWKEFGEWLVFCYGYQNMRIDKCNITIIYYFDSKRKHDADNYTPKNLFDSFTSSGLLIDDDFNHVQSLTIKGDYCKSNPRTEIIINY
jgi:Holliday junction resolvase RusA-like endonuclease